MVTRMTVSKVLEIAISREIESQRLYIDLGEQVKEAAAKYAFQELTRQEKGHQLLLEKYQRGELMEGSLGGSKKVDYKIAEHLEQPGLSPGMSLKDTFLIAANREKASHDFYTGFARIHPAGRVKSLLEDLAAQELGHKQRVEQIYSEIAFPQTDGG